MKTKLVTINPDKIGTAVIEQAAKVIDEGGLVGFPTETVYGIACRVQTDSLKKLSELKGRSPDKYYTLHVAAPAEVEKFVPSMSMRARKLVENAWPGPLTIVFELPDKDLKQLKKNLRKDVFDNLYKDNSIGIRCPDNPVASALLETTLNPVVAPSANVAGKQPPVEANQALKHLDGKIDMLLDAGPCKYKKPSSVVKIGKQGLEILRQGALPKDQIEQLSQVHILFVCTGNSCRSPMAEAMFKKYLAEKLDCEVDELPERGYKVSSAGTIGLTGMPATTEAIRACEAKGIDITNHRSTGLSTYLLEESDLVFAFAQMHQRAVCDLSSKAAQKCILLAGDTDITDPIGQSQQVYDNCAELIDNAVKKSIGELSI